MILRKMRQPTGASMRDGEEHGRVPAVRVPPTWLGRLCDCFGKGRVRLTLPDRPESREIQAGPEPAANSRAAT